MLATVAHLGFAVHVHQLDVHAGVGTPRSPALTLGLVTNRPKGPDSGHAPGRRSATMRWPISASSLSYRLSQMGCDRAAPA